MNISIWETIASTPWWVYLVFGMLIRAGWLATKPNVITLRNLYFYPIMLFAFSVVAVFATMTVNATMIMLWLMAAFLGSGLGWLQFRMQKIVAIKNEKKLHIPGTWSLLIIILVLFTLKHYFNFQLSINTESIQQPNVMASVIFLYGLFTGIFAGRLIYAVRCVRVGPYFTA